MSEIRSRTRAQRRRSRQIRLSITASVFLAVVVVLGISLSNGKTSSTSDSAGVVRDREVATATPEQDKTPGKDRPRTTSTPKATSTPDSDMAMDPQVGIAPEPTSATSVNAEGGLVPVISQVKTTDRVVFLTIDDGYEKDPAFKDYVVANKIPLTMFLVSQAAAAKPEFFSSIATVKGSSIQNHSVNHANLKTLSAAASASRFVAMRRRNRSYSERHPRFSDRRTARTTKQRDRWLISVECMPWFCGARLCPVPGCTTAVAPSSSRGTSS